MIRRLLLGGCFLVLILATTAQAQTITTDKDDYAPGETVTITGSGFWAGETVHLVFHEDPPVEHEHELYAVADAEGNFVNTDFAPDESHLGTTFTLVATGLSSGLTAETVFTDGAPSILSVLLNDSADQITVSPSQIIEVRITATTIGGPGPQPANWKSTEIAVSGDGGTGFGGTALCFDDDVVANNVAQTAAHSFDFSAPTSLGSYGMRIRAYMGDNCSGVHGSTTLSNILVVSDGQQALSTSLDVSGSATYGGTATLTAALSSEGSPVAGKQIVFSLGGNDVCDTDCPTTDAAGIATLTGVDITGYDAGTHTSEIGATFVEDDDYLGSSATGDLVVGKAGTTLSEVSGSGVFGGTATLTATLKSDGLGLEGKTIQFSLDGVDVCDFDCPTTDPDGIATLSGVDVSGYATAGIFPNHVTASFAGDTNYEASGDVNGDLTLADQTAPEVTALDVQPNPAGDETVTITATVSDASTGGSNVTEVYYTVDGGSPVAFTGFTPDVTLTDITATFSTTALSDGDNNVCVYGVDAESNSGLDDPECHTLVVDKAAPAVSGLAVNPNRVASGTDVTLSATISDVDLGGSAIASAEYRLNDGTWQAMSATSGTFDSDATIAVEAVISTDDLSPNSFDSHTLYVRGTDALGNVSSDTDHSITFVVDNLPPVVSNVTVDPTLLAAGSVVVEADVSDAGTGSSTITAAEYRIGTSGGWTAMEAAAGESFGSVSLGVTATIAASVIDGLGEGEHIVYVRATDQVGNTSSDTDESASFTLDLSPPEVSNVKTVDADGNAKDRLGKGQDLYLEGTADDALSAIKMIWYKVGEDGSNLGDRNDSWEEVPEGDLLDGAAYGADGTITFRTPLNTNLDHGGYKVCVVASDEWDQEGSVDDAPCATFFVDDRGPLVESLAVDADVIPPTGSVTATASIDDSGEQGGSNVASASWVVTNAADETVASDTETYDGDEVVENFSVTVEAPSDGWPGGTYDLCVTGTDEFGNEGDESCVSFDVDALPPSVTIVKTVDADGNEKDRLGKGQDLYLEGTADDALSAIKMIWYKVGEDGSDLGDRDDSWEEVPEGDLLEGAEYGADGTITFRTQLNTELEHGGYKVCVVASDEWDQEGSVDDAPCATFFVDDEAPIVSDVQVNPFPAYLSGQNVLLTALVDDTGDQGESNIASARFVIRHGDCEEDPDADECIYLDVDDYSMQPDGEGAQWDASPSLRVKVTLPAFTQTGVFEACVYGTDAVGNEGGPTCAFLPVVDPSAGFVTGGGWIDSPAGAYAANPELTGKANFGFVSKYEKNGKTKGQEELIVTGNTQFQFKAGELNFHSTAYEWLVIANHKAQYKGTGTINGAGSFQFMLTAIDGDVKGTGNPDLFRIKIWDAEGVVYDNNMGASDTDEPTTVLGGGSVVIHSGNDKVAGSSGKGKLGADEGGFGVTVEVPTDFALDQNYPNPFNPSTHIKFGLPSDSDVRVEVYDMLGRRVAQLANGALKAGYHTVSFEASDLASGVYVYRMAAVGDDGSKFEKTNTMVLMK